MKRLLALLCLISLVSVPATARRKAPKGWTKVDTIEGLVGEGWYTKKTRTCMAYAQEGDLKYVEPVVKGLDASFEANARFMGFRASGPLHFYFFPMTEPANVQPKFSNRVGRLSKFAGLALSGTDICLINMGNQQRAEAYATWEIEATARHEMNHLFAFQRVQRRGWSWFLEAIAENIEQTVLPRSSQMGVPEYKKYLRGYQSQDASWAALTSERNNNDVESYRDFGKLLSSVVSFFRAKYGQDAVAKILKAAPGRTVDEALKVALGKDAAALEVEWKAFYGIR